MKAIVAKPDGTTEIREMGDPVCGVDFCNDCGDCLSCYWNDCMDSSHCGGPVWLIEIEDPRNPYYECHLETGEVFKP